MSPADRFAWWISKPHNCNKVIAVFAGVAFAVLWMTGDYSPLP